jgi:predicted transcriptional regulator
MNSKMSASSAESYLDVILASEVRAELVALFHKNPGIIDTPEGIGRRIGLVSNAVAPDLEELAKLGVLSKKRYGNQNVFFLNKSKDSEIQQSIATYLQGMSPPGQG